MHKKLGRNTVVLLGVGHTNAHVVRMWKMNPIENADLVCISNFPIATYSGMVPGVLAGQYAPEAMEIDLVRLCASAGARLVIGEVIGLDRENQEILFRDRPPLGFDVLSIGVGSRPSFKGVEIAADNQVVAVKPMQTFIGRLRSRIESAVESGRTPKIVVVGGGIGSIEIAICLDERLKKDPESVGLGRENGAYELSLITGSQEIGIGLLASTREKISQCLDRRAIKSLVGKRVGSIQDDHLVLSDGGRIETDVIIWASSAIAPPVLGELGLETDDRGFLATRSTLQTVSDDGVFAVGDSGTMIGKDMAKAGVFAVRQGPVLWDNLKRSLWGRRLVDYVPQTDFLKLINTADGKTIAEHGERSYYGRWCWWLKNRIDTRFMKMYQDYTMNEMSGEAIADPEEVMRCLGCGGKIGSQLLSQVLDEIDVPPHEDVIIGLENPDDAAVIKTYDNRVSVTTDFFASPFDDPYLVGRISLLNSASDCCVMGAQPTAALAIVQLPLGHPRAQFQVMRELMAGSVEELKKMNATIIGGHSIEGPRLVVGFTVLGRQLTDPKTKGMLETGDRLVMTKPIGTGVLLSALMQGKLPGKAYPPLIDAMLQSNYVALRLIQEFGIAAITDVTGFGLAGHLAEMLVASGKSAEIQMAAVPLLEGCQALIESGIESTLAPDNRLVAEKVNFRSSGHESIGIASLFDPQTSGGLLFGVSEEASDRVLAFLRDEGFESTCVIGQVVEQAGPRSALDVV